MAITSVWPVIKDWITNLPNRLDNRDYNLADDMNEVRQFMIQSEQLMGDFTYGGGIATMFATAQNTPIMNVRIGGGSVWFGGSKVEKFAGPYTSPMVTAPIGNPRIDVLTMNTSGVFAWTVGTPAGSPAAPAYPTGKLPICEIYVPVGATRIVSTVEEATGADAYILNHRPIKPDMIVPGSGGHIFKDEGGSPLTQRTYANFIGAHVTATDNSGADSTDITVDDLLTIASKSANYTATVDDRLLSFDCTSGNKTLTLYTATAHAGMWLYVIKTDVSVNTLTIDPNGAELINNAANLVLANQFDAALIYVNGTSWFVLSKATASGGGHTIQNNGTPLTQRTNLNIKPAGIASDDPGNNATIIDLTSLGGGIGGGITLAKGFIKLSSADITTTSTSFVDLTGASLTLITSGNDVELVAMFRANEGSLGSDPYFNFSVDGTDVDVATNGILGFDQAGSVGYDTPVTLRWRVTSLAAGSHVFKVRWRVSGGTGTVRADSTQPTFFWANEIPQFTMGNTVGESLAHGEVLKNNTDFTTTSATPVDITDLTITIVTHGGPVLLICEAMVNNPSGGNATILDLIRDSTRLGNVADGLWYKSTVGDETMTMIYMDRPAAGTYVYKVQMMTTGGVTGKLYAGGGNVANFSAQELPTNFASKSSIMFGNLWGTVMGTSNAFFGFGQSELVDTVETNVMQVIPFACTARNFSVRHFGTQAGGGTTVLTIRKNGVDTAVVVTIPAASTGNQKYNSGSLSVAFAAGDEISIKGIRTSAGANLVGYSLELVS